MNPVAGLFTSEAGGRATFTARLNSEPTDDVTIGLTSSNTIEGTVSPAGLTFTSLNWNTAQTVTVTGQDDEVQDGSQAYFIITTIVSSDINYNDMNVPDVSVSNTDDDGSFFINNNDLFVYSTSVILNMNIFDVSDMRFSNNEIDWTNWTFYSSTANWMIPSGHSGKTVYAQFRDLGGHIFQKKDTITPLIEENITSSDGSSDDYFSGNSVLHGSSVSISANGDTIVVGAMSKNGGRGSAYVCRLIGSIWKEYILSPGIVSSVGDNFGISVSVSSDGDTVVIGAWRNEANGSIYIYKWNGNTYIESQILKATLGFDRLGLSISISSDASTIVSGAYYSSVGANTDQGAAYIYKLNSDNYGIWDGTKWVENQKIVASEGENMDRFGMHVSLSNYGNIVIVGAPSDDINTNPDQGSVYVFRLNDEKYGIWSGSNWVENQKVSASDGDANDMFGVQVSVSASGDTLLIGAQGDDVNLNIDQGSVYIFQWDSISRKYGIWNPATLHWDENNKITAIDGGDANDNYGYSVSISMDGKRLIIGAIYDDIFNNIDQGSIYIYDWNGNSWIETKLYASDGSSGDFFGYSVSTSADGHIIIVGAPGDDISSNLNQGSVYIY